MKPVKILRPLIGLYVLVPLCVPASSGPTKTPLPDIFLITIDTLRADHVHCYGYIDVATPALDALAKDGVRFTQAFTPSPITNSSHASILTGLLPGSHGVTDFGVPLSAIHPTVAELLKAKAYHTGAFIGAVILDSKTLAPGFERGFDFYDNFPEHSLTKSRWGRLERRGMDVVRPGCSGHDVSRVGRGRSFESRIPAKQLRCQRHDHTPLRIEPGDLTS